MSHLFIDLETRSPVSVRDVGAFAYAEHPETAILCCAWAFDDQPVRCLTYEQCIDTTHYGPLHGLLDEAFHGGDTIFVAHNCDFERNVLARKVTPEIADISHWTDTTALAAGLGLPRSLEELLAFLFPDDPTKAKDMAGNRVMMKLSMPRRPSKDDPSPWWTPASKPEDFQKLYDYCKQDVEGMRAAFKKLRPLSERELAVWRLTDKMNWTGVKLDVASIPVAQAYLEKHLAPLRAEWDTLCPHPPKSYAKVAEHFGMPDVKKVTVRHALRESTLAVGTRRALELFRTLGLSSPAKLTAMLDRVSADGRLRGALVYGGAERTLRWSSFGVQLQNFKRGLGELTDAAFEALHAGVLDVLFEGIERQAPEPPADAVALLAEIMRGFLVGPFLASDFSQIECRTLAWIAGEESLLQQFRNHVDPYCAMASRHYQREITKKDKSERFMFKQVVLGCGYQMGHIRFKNMLDEIYDVSIEEDFAKRVVSTYRSSVPNIVNLWKKLQDCFTFTLTQKAKRVKMPGLKVPIYMGTETIGGIFYVWIELPSGRRLWYAGAHIKDKEIRYYGRNIFAGGRWEMIATHGGRLCENAVQATSRDVMAEAMLRLDAAGFALRFTVHDEIVAEDDLTRDRIDEFHGIMTQMPTWAEGLPVEAETFRSARYRK